MKKSTFTIAIAGNPNCGKTALFNALTGSHQVVGNWPGVTVEKKEGFFILNNQDIKVVDLPGAYALFANSEDEKVAVDYLLSKEANLILNIVDATNLERNLFLTTQLAEMEVPLVLVVNMMDIATKRGLVLDLEKLSELLGIPVFSLTAVSDKSIAAFVKNISKIVQQEPKKPNVSVYPENIENIINECSTLLKPVAEELKTSTRWISLQYLSGSAYIQELAEKNRIRISRTLLTEKLGEEPEFALAHARYESTHNITKQITQAILKTKTFSDKLDKILLNRFLGIPCFLIAMFLVFWVTVTVGSAFIDFFDILFGSVFVDGTKTLLNAIHAPGFITAILADGIGSGIQVVSTFIPIIFFMFLSLSFLEDSGYMARAAFVADRFMRFLGLPGKAFVPMMVGFGCSVPAIMGTRTLESKRERFLTIFLIPFMSCGARLPVYALFAAAFFGAKSGALVFGLYLIGIIFAILYGIFLRHSLFKGESSSFVMELPPYHFPKIKSLFIHTWLRLKDYIKRAGKVIILAVTVLGFLNSFSFNGTFGNADSEDSVLSSIGKAITPVFEPFGIEEDNWPASVSLFTGLLAKEAVIGTLNSLYSINEASENAEDSGEDSWNFTESLKEAVLSVPENLSGVLSSVLDPLGIQAEMETETDASLLVKNQTALLEKFKAANVLTEEELETFKTMDEESESIRQIAISKLLNAGITVTPDDLEVLNNAKEVEFSDAFKGIKNSFTKCTNGFNFQVFAFLLFILLYVPCLATMGVVIKELGYFYGILMAVVQTVIAWAIATLTFQIPVGNDTFWIVFSAITLVIIAIAFKIIGHKHSIKE